MSADTVFTPSGVRLRRRAARPGPLNWLLLPGGPGIGSESLHELADAMAVPGAVWMVDLPGDGSNTGPPGASADPFASWPGALVEAAAALPNAVYVGHSTGGMYLLATPKVEAHIAGLVLISTAPDASWHPRYVEVTQRDPLPAVEAAAAIYEREPTAENLRDLAVASAPWNFTPGALAAGRELLARMPYNGAAVAWSDRHFDHTYVARWWPRSLPTLIVGGAEDRIVWQGGWDQPRFEGAHVLRRSIDGAGHFPWIDQPARVTDLFALFAPLVQRRLAAEAPG